MLPVLCCRFSFFAGLDERLMLQGLVWFSVEMWRGTMILLDGSLPSHTRKERAERQTGQTVFIMHHHGHDLTITDYAIRIYLRNPFLDQWLHHNIHIHHSRMVIPSTPWFFLNIYEYIINSIPVDSQVMILTYMNTIGGRNRLDQTERNQRIIFLMIQWSSHDHRDYQIIIIKPISHTYIII